MRLVRMKIANMNIGTSAIAPIHKEIYAAFSKPIKSATASTARIRPAFTADARLLITQLSKHFPMGIKKARGISTPRSSSSDLGMFI